MSIITTSTWDDEIKSFIKAFRIQSKVINDENLIRVEVSYELNEIPTASFNIGINDTGWFRRVSLDEAVGDNFILTYRGKPLFRGAVTSAAISREIGGASQEFSALHWAADLAVVSTASSQLISSGVWDFRTPYAVKDDSGELSISPQFIFSGKPGDLLNDIKNLLKQVKKSLYSVTLETGEESSTSSDWQQLRKFDSTVSAVENILDRLDFKLNLTSGSILSSSYVMVIRNVLTDITNGVSIWEILNTLAAAFGFVMAPTAQKIYIMPLAIDTSEYIKLGPEDCAKTAFSQAAVKPVRGLVFVMNSIPTLSGALMSNAPVPVRVYDFGNKGVFYPEQVPPWLNIFAHMTDKKPEESKLKKGARYIRKTLGDPAPVKDSVKSTINLSSTLLNKWARWKYYFKRYEGSELNIIANFRTDIAPGSVVKVFAPVTDNATKCVIGIVDKVKLVADSINHYAATELGIKYVSELTDVGAIFHPIFTGYLEKHDLC